MNDKRYVLEGYDKDNDGYDYYLFTDNLQEAINKGEELRLKVNNDELISSFGEPIDWVEIWDNLKEEMVMIF